MNLWFRSLKFLPNRPRISSNLPSRSFLSQNAARCTYLKNKYRYLSLLPPSKPCECSPLKTKGTADSHTDIKDTLRDCLSCASARPLQLLHSDPPSSQKRRRVSQRHVGFCHFPCPEHTCQYCHGSLNLWFSPLAASENHLGIFFKKYLF